MSGKVRYFKVSVSDCCTFDECLHIFDSIKAVDGVNRVEVITDDDIAKQYHEDAIKRAEIRRTREI